MYRTGCYHKIFSNRYLCHKLLIGKFEGMKRVNCLKNGCIKPLLFVMMIVLLIFSGCQSQRQTKRYKMKKAPCRECPSFGFSQDVSNSLPLSFLLIERIS